MVTVGSMLAVRFMNSIHWRTCRHSFFQGCERPAYIGGRTCSKRRNKSSNARHPRGLRSTRSCSPFCSGGCLALHLESAEKPSKAFSFSAMFWMHCSSAPLGVLMPTTWKRKFAGTCANMWKCTVQRGAPQGTLRPSSCRFTSPS